MRRGGSVLILLGIILGLVTAGGTFLVLSSSQPQVQQIQTQPVVIAIQNIPLRTAITAESVGTQQWPVPIPTGAIGNVDEVIGKLTVGPIYQGEIILPQMFIDKGNVGASRSNASYIIPDGKVAVAFPLNTLASVANAVQVGDSVDLLLTLSASGSNISGSRGTESQAVTQLMLQDVQVIQLGSWNTGGGQQAAAADIMTVIVDRQDALALKSAREQGSIELALRPAGDHKQATTEPVTLEYITRRFGFTLR